MSNIHQPEPTVDPDFGERYRAVMQAWQAGDATAKDAASSLENLLEEAYDDKNAMHMGSVELNIGIIEGYLANFVQSTRHFELARQHFDAAGAQSQVITCDLNIGEVYRLQGNLTRAQKFFRRAYQDAKKLDNKRTVATALTNEGQTWLSLGSLNKAADCLNQAIEVAKNPFQDEEERIYITRMGILAEIYHALTQIAIQNGDPDAAWLLARQSYKYGEETQHPMRLGFGNRAVADAITALGISPDPAFEDDPDVYYRIALDNFKKLKLEGDIAKTLFARGNSLVKRGKRSAAAKLYQRALAIFSKLDMTDDAAKVAEAQFRATG